MAVVKAPSPVWWLLLESIAMISLAPIVGDRLNGMEKQGKLNGFWAKFLVWLLMTVINATAVTLSVYFVVLSLGQPISSEVVASIWFGAGAWAGAGDWVFASDELLESVGKWKALFILLGTGLVGMSVGLLVKVLFGL